jgi:hypothetical protein
MDEVKNRRIHTRLALQLDAEVEVDGTVVARGFTRNISFGGVCVDCAPASLLVVQKICILRMLLTDGPEPATITISAEVVRTEGNCFSLRFRATDPDSFNHFKNIMVFNADDPDALLAELERSPGLQVKKD